MRTPRYYLIRRIVRYTIWIPIALYCFIAIIVGWANAI